MDQISLQSFALWQMSQHMKPHGTIRPRLSRQETISSLVYRPPDELVNAVNRPWDWETNPIRVDVQELDQGLCPGLRQKNNGDQ